MQPSRRSRRTTGTLAIVAWFVWAAIGDPALWEKAERLTIEMARRAGSDRSAAVVELPKIEGKAMPQKSN